MKLQAFYIILEEDTKLYRQIQQQVSDTIKDLPNKYLYLGGYGAYLWNEIERTYQPGIESSNSLKENFPEIDTIIRDDKEITPSETYNIISLGCGTGNDDIAILNVIKNNKNKESINYFTIDLSIGLLKQGTEKIEKEINNLNITKVKKICGLCVDIEHLNRVKDRIKSENKNFFHLLGLTIANNKERDFLISIYNVMKNGDYLLLGVDFSGRSKRALKESVNAYTTGKQAASINKFLCSPLAFAVDFQQENYKNKTAKLQEKNMEYFKNIKVLHKVEYQNSYSAVPDAKSLVRYHVYSDGITRICDYSHKYSPSGFKKFLENLENERNICFDIVPNGNLQYFKYTENRKTSSQYLVLLRKNNKSIEENKENDEIKIDKPNDKIKI